MLGHDIKRAVCSWPFWASILIGFISATYIYYIPAIEAVFILKVPWSFCGENSLSSLAEFFGMSFLSTVLPLLCVLSFGTSVSDDTQSGMLRLLLYRSGRRRYLVSRLLSIALSGALACAVVAVLLVLVGGLVFPLVNTMIGSDPDNGVYLYRASWAFQNAIVGRETFWLYGLWKVALYFSGGFIWSVVTAGISTWLPNRYFAFAAPVVLYLVCCMMFRLVGNFAPYIAPYTLFDDTNYYGNGFMQLVVRLGWLVCGTVSYFLAGRRLVRNA